MIRFLFFLLVLNAYLIGFGQVYHPFPDGYRSLFAFKTVMDPGHAWEEVYIDSIIAQGTDTLYILNAQIRPAAESEICTGNNSGMQDLFRLLGQPGNLGTRCMYRNGLEFGLVNPYGDTLWLRTRDTIGTYWNSRPHVAGFDTAKIVSYSLDSIFGNILDSVVHIQYSGSRLIKISKHHGVIYFDGFLISIVLFGIHPIHPSSVF